MKRLNYLVLAAGLTSMAAWAASPQEVSLLVDGVYVPSLGLVNDANTTLSSFDAVKPTGLGLRYGIEPWAINMKCLNAAVGADFTLHSHDKKNLTVNGADAGDYHYQYWGLGVHARATCILDFAAGLDLRSEQVKLDAVSGAGGSTTLTRPWARASAGRTFGAGDHGLFVRLEGAVPLKNKNRGDLDSGKDARTSLAPTCQLGLNVGMRF